MPTEKIFDAHFHMLFKHFITNTPDISTNIRVKGIAQLLDELFGGLFDSQSSPKLISESNLYVGVTSLIALEHAFANKILSPGNINFYGVLSQLDQELIKDTKSGKRTYYGECKRQLDMYLNAEKILNNGPYNIHYLRRSDWQGSTVAEITEALSAGDKRYIAFSIEGGHNLSNVPIRNRDNMQSLNPELQLEEIQNRQDVDIMSLNLCHLSHIPEQTLGGFAQGLNKTSQIAFSSDDFMPKTEFGLTERGKKVIRQALTHPAKPVLIDVKHMSVYTRYHYYRYREKLISEQPDVERLPILSSHTGFAFVSMPEYLKNKMFASNTYTKDGALVCEVSSENRVIGKTNDKRNANLYANPWSINLFDDEIVEIMQSKGLIGVSMDQRVLGAVKFLDGTRPQFYEKEFIAAPEWQRLFRDGQFPSASEGLLERILNAPTRAERHIMLFCAHLVHAAAIGYEEMFWAEGTSPWDHLCIGSDFDGLINPLNGFDNITMMKNFKGQLLQYLPVADKLIVDGKSLKYDPGNGKLDTGFLEKVVNNVLFDNGVRFVASFLRNWK